MSLSRLSRYSDEYESESSDSDVEDLLLLLAAAASRKRKRQWIHPINQKRQEYGEYNRLCRELLSDEDKFFTYFRMSKTTFEELHTLLEPVISKRDTNWRRAISSKERLAICMRFLATGDSYKTIAFSFRVGRSTVGNIVENVCEELWNILQPIYLATPTEETWRRAEIGYREIWKFPNCLGSIDGKHVPIKCPKNSGSNFYCYKNFFSIVLLAIVDPYYKFIVVDIGSCGRFSDSGIFENSAFFKEFLEGKTLLPPKTLPGTEDLMPHVLIGDEGFGLKPYLMRPFPQAAAIRDPSKRNYNKRLCTARRVVENVFGILAEKWRVFHRPMEVSVNTAEAVVKAACCLHNFVREKDGLQIRSRRNTNSLFMSMTHAAPATNHQINQPPQEAFDVRNKFVTYFENY